MSDLADARKLLFCYGIVLFGCGKMHGNMLDASVWHRYATIHSNFFAYAGRRIETILVLPINRVGVLTARHNKPRFLKCPPPLLLGTSVYSFYLVFVCLFAAEWRRGGGYNRRISNFTIMHNKNKHRRTIAGAGFTPFPLSKQETGWGEEKGLVSPSCN